MANHALECIQGRTYFLPGPANVGVIDAGNGQAILVDAGNDEDGGRRILRACEATGLAVSQILNTHSNADHCGGNAFIQARSKCRISATRAEAAFIETPVLEPSYLWGGFPLAALRNKFLMAKPSRVTEILEPPCKVAGTDIDVISLPGHFLGMAGFMTPDRVFFAADTVASEAILAKYHVFYLFDIAAHLETLGALTRLQADWIVPSHAAPTQNIGPLVAVNRAKIHEIAEHLLEWCAVPSTPEDLLARLCGHYGIELNHAQYVLIGSTLRSYLTWLCDRKALSSSFEAGRLFLERA